MAHTNILGSTGFGKTTYAVKMAKVATRLGRPVGVLDPMAHDRARWPENAFVTSDVTAFEDWCREQLNAFVFIDEGHSSIGGNIWDESLHWLFLYGRHYGHRVTVMTQYPMHLPPAVRLNCANLVCFNMDGESAYRLSRMYGCPLINEAPTLQKMQFIFVERGNNDEASKQQMIWEY